MAIWAKLFICFSRVYPRSFLYINVVCAPGALLRSFIHLLLHLILIDDTWIYLIILALWSIEMNFLSVIVLLTRSLLLSCHLSQLFDAQKLVLFYLTNERTNKYEKQEKCSGDVLLFFLLFFIWVRTLDNIWPRAMAVEFCFFKKLLLFTVLSSIICWPLVSSESLSYLHRKLGNQQKCWLIGKCLLRKSVDEQMKR